MEIVGNGVDIIKNSRVKNLIKNPKFLSRIFSVNEIKDSKKIKNKTNFFAKRFAAKEAFVKSIGIGFRKGINFKDISVKKNKLGKPIITYNNKVKKILKKKFKSKKFNVYVSLSDEKYYSIAYVIVNKL
jgi:holo-[acyl-carrier protein] synthase